MSKTRQFTFGQYVHAACRVYPCLYKISGEQDMAEWDIALQKAKESGLSGDALWKVWYPQQIKESEARYAAMPMDSFTDDQKMRMSQRVADHLLCVIGNGIDWEDGLPSGLKVKRNEPTFLHYEYEDKFKWYPLCGYSAICQMSGVLTEGTSHELGRDIPHPHPTFLRAAFNVLRSILNHGGGVLGSSADKHYPQQLQEQLRVARLCLAGLAKRHPDAIPENCDPRKLL